jgi:hypothetical protein
VSVAEGQKRQNKKDKTKKTKQKRQNKKDSKGFKTFGVFLCIFSKKRGTSRRFERINHVFRGNLRDGVSSSPKY